MNHGRAARSSLNKPLFSHMQNILAVRGEDANPHAKMDHKPRRWTGKER